MANKNIINLILDLYTNQKMSSPEIQEYLKNSNISDLGVRSIQRYIAKYKKPRSQKESTELALLKQRKKGHIPQKLQIQRRIMDEYECQLCNENRVNLLKVKRIKPLEVNEILTVNHLLTLCLFCLKHPQESFKTY